MGTQHEDYRLSFDERIKTRLYGINEAIAAQVGTDPNKLEVRSSKNVQHIFKTAIQGFMEVSAEWTEAGTWHWQSFRFNGSNEVPLNEQQLTELGSMAMARATETHDFSYTDPVVAQELPASVHELSLAASSDTVPQQRQPEEITYAA